MLKFPSPGRAFGARPQGSVSVWSQPGGHSLPGQTMAIVAGATARSGWDSASENTRSSLRHSPEATVRQNRAGWWAGNWLKATAAAHPSAAPRAMAKIGDMPTGGGGPVAAAAAARRGADQVQPLGGPPPHPHGELITGRAPSPPPPEAAVLSSLPATQRPGLGQIHGSRLGHGATSGCANGPAWPAAARHLVGCVQLALVCGQLVILTWPAPPATGYCSAERRGWQGAGAAIPR